MLQSKDPVSSQIGCKKENVNGDIKKKWKHKEGLKRH